jgi:hypothetical protein
MLFGSPFHTIYSDNPISGNMPFPSPLLSPNEFLDYVRSLGLDSIITLFQHYHERPFPSPPGDCYDISDMEAWCDRMDMLLVSSDLSSQKLWTRSEMHVMNVESSFPVT